MEKEIKVEPEGFQADGDVKLELLETCSSINTQNAPKRKKMDIYNKNGKKSCNSPKASTSIKTAEMINESTKGIHDMEVKHDKGKFSWMFSLMVSNLPVDWTETQIKNYLKDFKYINLEEILRMEMIEKGTVRLTFQTLDKCKDVYEKIKDMIIEGKKLKVEKTGAIQTMPESNNIKEESTKEDVAQAIVEVEDFKSWKANPDLWKPKGLYGLRPQFLKSMNIKPPLSIWVHVSNFTCSKADLKEVMELAGNVRMCCVLRNNNRFAKIMYSHPLEAIQAISMLNGRMYNGTPLKVVLDENPTNTVILPKGLLNIGLGLGLDGMPLRNVAQEYEKYISHKNSLLNPVVFMKKHYIDEETGDFVLSDEDDLIEIQRKINEFVAATQNNATQRSFKVMNAAELDDQDSNFKNENNRGTSNSKVSKDDDIKIKSTSPCSFSIGEVEKVNEKPDKPPTTQRGPRKCRSKPCTPTQVYVVQDPSMLIRAIQQNPDQFSVTNLGSNSQNQHNPMGPVGPPNFGAGPANYSVPVPAGLQGASGPVSLMPVQAPFDPRMPTAFGPPVHHQMSPANYNASGTFVGPNHFLPNWNPGPLLTLHFSNLPPSTTFPSLCEKLARCGQLMSVQFTSPGCAIVSYRHPAHAKTCFQSYNGTHMDGCKIVVKYA